MHLKRSIIPLLLAAFLVVSAAPRAAAYSDTDSTWAKEVIDKAAQYGLMEGYPDGRFGVGEDMTRAQFITVLCRMLGWAQEEPADLAFPDVKSHWALGYLCAAAGRQVVDYDTPVRPNDPISRAEMAELLTRALGYAELAQSRTEAELPFPDVSPEAGYRGAVALSYELGLLNGVPGPGGTLRFLPDDSAPREQCAALLVRCYERYTASTEWLHGFYAFSSYDQIGYTPSMDAVSLGWAQLQYRDGPILNDTTAYKNDWVKPQGAELVTDYLNEHALPYHLSVFSGAAAFASTVDAGAQDAAISLLVEAARPYAGLTIDFEGLKAERKEAFTAFMTALRAALPTEKALYVCVQPDTWFGGFDFRALGELCDKVIMMAHDYHWTEIPAYYLGTDRTYCPVTPLSQVHTTLLHLSDPETGVQDRSKLAIQIAFGTAGFHVDENGLLADTTFYHPIPSTIARRLTQEGTLYTWDPISHNPFIQYTTESGDHYKLWYEDSRSVADKLALARMLGITGVSVWRLGTIPDYPDIPGYNVWDVLSAR